MAWWQGSSKKNSKQKQADSAHAIRDVLTPTYLKELADFQAIVRSERLRGVIERVEMVAQRQETIQDDAQASDSLVINTAQQLVTALNNIAEPKLRLRYALTPDGPTAGEFVDPETKAIRDTAKKLALPLKSYVPAPTLGTHHLG